jgi:hypothetical protein
VRFRRHRRRDLRAGRARPRARTRARAAKAGALVIDGQSGVSGSIPTCPLVAPDAHPEALARPKRGIVAVPGAVASMLAIALRPLHDRAGAKRVVVATYESVSGAGKAAMDELFDQTRAVYVNQPITREQFAKQIAFNVIPQVDAFGGDGYTAAETALAAELARLIDPVCASSPPRCACPPSSASVRRWSPSSHALSTTAPRAACGGAGGGGEAIGVVDHRTDEGYVTPVETVGEDKILCQPRAARPDRRQRPRLLVRRRQPAPLRARPRACRGTAGFAGRAPRSARRGADLISAEAREGQAEGVPTTAAAKTRITIPATRLAQSRPTVVKRARKYAASEVITTHHAKAPLIRRPAAASRRRPMRPSAWMPKAT